MTTPSERVYQAWRNPGPRPDVHNRAKDELRRTWPVLAAALDAMPAPGPSPAAQALREAADAMALPGSTDVGYYAGYADSGYSQAESDAEEWLRERAASIEGQILPPPKLP